MTRKLLFLAAIFSVLQTQGQKLGYEIQVTLKPFKNQYIYLGHYFGKTYPIIDSVKLDGNSRGVFKGDKLLPGGIYLIGYPNKTGFFEILIDKQQRFGLSADTATVAQSILFENSPDNVSFLDYQQTMLELGTQIRDLQAFLKAGSPDSVQIRKNLKSAEKQMNDYRLDLINNHSQTLLGALMIAMRETELPAALRRPANVADSMAAYRFYKDHYWDGVNFWDGRLAYTPFFEERVDRYFKQLVAPDSDSVIREIDNMMAFAQINAEMTRLLLVKFLNQYLAQQYMWEDAVLVHLYEKYISNKSYPWLDEKGRKIVQDRAFSLMGNILKSPAAEVELPNAAGEIKSLYALTSEYTLVVFWDPTCGHCKETLPRIDSIYRAKWSKQGIGIYAIAKETEGNQSLWTDFIQQNQLVGWTHVYYSKEAEKKRIDNGIPSYSQLFDVQTFPTLYLLDRDKKIIAKKLTFQQMDEILDLQRAETN
ncbi:MAG: thioredoxin-like domain-containing protein [Bacteroidota bacterium]